MANDRQTERCLARDSNRTNLDWTRLEMISINEVRASPFDKITPTRKRERESSITITAVAHLLTNKDIDELNRCLVITDEGEGVDMDGASLPASARRRTHHLSYLLTNFLRSKKAGTYLGTNISRLSLCRSVRASRMTIAVVVVVHQTSRGESTFELIVAFALLLH